MRSNKILRSITLLLSSLCISLALCYAIMAWTEPGAGVTPPDGNVAAPLNTGASTQTKLGDLNVSGKVGIGTTSPSTSLDVNGTARATEVKAPGIIKQMLTTVEPNNISTASTSYVDIPGLSITAQTGNSNLFILWNAGIAVTGTANRCQVRILVDGVQVGAYVGGGYSFNATGDPNISVDSMGGNTVAPVSPGTHTIKLQWRNATDITSGTSYIWPNADDGYGGNLTVMEVSSDNN